LGVGGIDITDGAHGEGAARAGGVPRAGAGGGEQGRVVGESKDHVLGGGGGIGQGNGDAFGGIVGHLDGAGAVGTAREVGDAQGGRVNEQRAGDSEVVSAN